MFFFLPEKTNIMIISMYLQTWMNGGITKRQWFKYKFLILHQLHFLKIFKMKRKWNIYKQLYFKHRLQQ